MENDDDFKFNKKLTVRICDANVFIDRNNFNLPIQSRIIEINHKPVSTIIKDIKKIIPTDVTNSNYRIRKIEKDFLYYYNLFYQYKGDTYTIKIVQRNGGQRIRKIIRKDVISNSKEEEKKPLIFTTQSGTACLMLSSFYTPDFTNNKLPPKKTIKLIFKQIHDCNIDTLIIDLRDNQGGSVVLASHMFSFLVCSYTSNPF